MFNHKRSKFNIIERRFKALDRVSNGKCSVIIAEKKSGWKLETSKNAVRAFGASQYNRGKNSFTVSPEKISKDLREMGLDISRATVERGQKEMREAGELVVRKQGFVFRNANRKMIKAEATVYSLSVMVLNFLNELTNNFFTGMKKIAKTLFFRHRENGVEKVLNEKYVYSLWSMRNSEFSEMSQEDKLEYLNRENYFAIGA